MNQERKFTMSKGKEVVIVGGGIAGSSVAYHLTKRGIKPLIIERDSVGARASGKAWGYCPHPANILFLEQAEGKFYSMPVEDLKRQLYVLCRRRLGE